MRQFLAGLSNWVIALAVTLLTLVVSPSFLNVARSDSSGSNASEACNSDELVIYQDDRAPDREPACASFLHTPAEIAQARAYLVATASPGYTMTLQGRELAIGRLHPEFAVRLEHAIREARSAGLASAAIFSAYRPPAFGVGGFHDKFNSLHTYGLAVDMRGIGQSGSAEAQLWHAIAAKNGVVCPYGPHDRAEWNHCQPTSIKIITAGNPLRETVNATGPLDLENMFEVGDTMIDDMASAADSLGRAAPTRVRMLEAAASGTKPTPALVSHTKRRNPQVAALRHVAVKPVRHAKLGPHIAASRMHHT